MSWIIPEKSFLGMLSRANRQMDDQRGVSIKGLELPEFLRVTKGQNDKRSSSGLSQLDKTQSDPALSTTAKEQDSDADSHSQLGNHVRMHSDASLHNNSFNPSVSPRSGRIPYADESFSQNGMIPTPNRATNYFSTTRSVPQSPNFEDSRLMEGNLKDIGLGSSFHTDLARSDSLFRKSCSDVPIAELPARLSPSARPVPQPRVPPRRNPPPAPASDSYSSQSSISSGVSEDDPDVTLIPPSDSNDEDDDKATIQEKAPIPAPRHNPDSSRTLDGDKVGDAEVQSLMSQSVPQNSAIDSPAGSTPSPTTHDLILEPDDSDPEHAPHTPPQPPKRTSIMKNVSDRGEAKAKKSLVFDSSEANGDMLVSFV